MVQNTLFECENKYWNHTSSVWKPLFITTTNQQQRLNNDFNNAKLKARSTAIYQPGKSSLDDFLYDYSIAQSAVFGGSN